VGLLRRKWQNLPKTAHSEHISIVTVNMTKICCFFNISSFFPKQTHKMDKITSPEDDIRKILRPKI
jgi:hypothetical protein